MVLSKDRVTATPGWDTLTVAVCTVPPVVVVNVTVAGRVSTVVFAVAVNVTVPFAVPVAGDTVNQVWSEVTFHAAFDVTATVVFAPADDGKVHAVLSNDKVTAAPGCVTLTVAVCTGVPVVVCTVTVAGRAPTVVFAAAVNVIDPLFEPVAGDTVNHV